MTSNEQKLLVILKEFQDAERRYTDAVNDLISAEIRRDVAKRERDECYARLEKARAKYSYGILEDPPKHGKPKGGKGEAASGRSKSVRAGGKGNNIQDAKDKFGEDKEAGPAKSGDVASQKKIISKDKPIKSNGVSAKEPLPKESMSKNNGKSLKTKHKHDGVSSQPQSFKKLVTIEPLSEPINILDICKGRTRQWLDKHLDCDSLGLVRNFYKASFGTRTNPRTQKLSVATVLISDEWNVLATTTANVHELYIGTGGTNNNKIGIGSGAKYQTNLRDKVAEVLAEPQTDSIALFYAPKKKNSYIYFGGHWRVKGGKKLDPPKLVMGQLRQCYLKLVFVGVNPALVDAINGKVTKL